VKATNHMDQETEEDLGRYYWTDEFGLCLQEAITASYWWNIIKKELVKLTYM
jgi:hypothetical protein